MSKIKDKIKGAISRSVTGVQKGASSAVHSVEEAAPKVVEKVGQTTKNLAAEASEAAPVIAEKAKKAAAVAAEKTGEVLTRGKLHLELANVKHKRDKKLAELGSRVYELLKKKGADVYADETVQTVSKEIKDLEKNIASLEKEFAEVGKKEEKKEETASGKTEAEKKAEK